jgi:hypothetical protein
MPDPADIIEELWAKREEMRQEPEWIIAEARAQIERMKKSPLYLLWEGVLCKLSDRARSRLNERIARLPELMREAVSLSSHDAMTQGRIATNVALTVLEIGEQEEAEMTMTAILERLDRIEVLEAMRAETLDSVRQTVERIAEHFPDESVREAAAGLLDVQAFGGS